MDAGFQSQEYLASLVGLPRGSGATAHAYPRTVIPVSAQGKTGIPQTQARTRKGEAPVLRFACVLPLERQPGVTPTERCGEMQSRQAQENGNCNQIDIIYHCCTGLKEKTNEREERDVEGKIAGNGLAVRRHRVPPQAEIVGFKSPD